MVSPAVKIDRQLGKVLDFSISVAFPDLESILMAGLTIKPFKKKLKKF